MVCWYDDIWDYLSDTSKIFKFDMMIFEWHFKDLQGWYGDGDGDGEGDDDDDDDDDAGEGDDGGDDDDYIQSWYMLILDTW